MADASPLSYFKNVPNREEVREEIFKKGQSKRIWGELYKVLLPLTRYRRGALRCRIITLQLCFLLLGNRFVWRHHPSAGCPWSDGNALQEHWELPEKGETLETFDFCFKQVWPDPYLGYCESSVCWWMHLFWYFCVKLTLFLFQFWIRNAGSRSCPQSIPHLPSMPALPTLLVRAPLFSCSGNLER